MLPAPLDLLGCRTYSRKNQLVETPMMYIREVIKAKAAISKGPLLCLIFSISCFPWVSILKCRTHILWFGFVLLAQYRPLRFMDQYLQPDFEVLARPESTSFGFSNGWIAETWMKTFCLSPLSHSCETGVPSTQGRDMQGVLHPLGWRNVLCDRDLVKRSKDSADWKIGAVSNYELILPR